MKVLSLLTTAGILACHPTLVSAQEAPVFESQIRPLLQKRCTECHGAKKQKGELRWDAKPFALKGGHDGPATVAGKTADSPIFKRITSSDEDTRMPPEGERLTETEIAAVKAWIESGAVWPENDADWAATADKRAQHWSVQSLRTFQLEGTSLRITHPSANGLPASALSVELPPETPIRSMPSSARPSARTDLHRPLRPDAAR
jgi:mono/diheme cytochrome c family protein